jgi:hypothetical protein
MAMSTATLFVQISGWLCVALLVLLLQRSVRGRTLREYPAFYSYATCVFIMTAVGLAVRWPSGGAYRTYYWTVESISVLLGIAVTWEIYRKILALYPGVRRLACMLLLTIFVLVTLFSVSGRADTPFTLLALERDLRTVQAIVLLILFALVAYYGIPLGRNIRGIAIGYVFGVATAVLNLSLRNYIGRGFTPIFNYARAIEFAAMLGIWCATLWSRQPDPVPPNTDIEHDYEWVSGQAVQAMTRLRGHLIHPDGS